jgi:hypothetical protein
MKTKHIIRVLLIALLPLVLPGCASVIKPATTVTKQQRSVTGFRSIEVENAITLLVSITEHDHETIEIEASENLHQYIVTDKDGDRLVVKLQEDISVDGPAVIRVYVGAKRVDELIASGASVIILQNSLRQDKLELTLSGASTFSGTIETDKFEADLSGASSADVSGFTDKLVLKETGASTFGNYALVSDLAKVDLSGASRAELMVNKEVDVEASGASTLNYKGSGTIDSQDLSGGSAVNKL